MAKIHNPASKTPKSTADAPVEVDDNKPATIVSRSHEDTLVYKALSSFRPTLLLGGLIFKKEFSKTVLKRHLTVSRVYSFIVLIFISFNTIRWLTMFQSYDMYGTHLFMKIVVCIFVCNQWPTCHLSLRLSLMGEWEKIGSSSSPSLTSIWILSQRCTVIIWSTVLCFVAACTYLIFFTDLLNMQLAPWDRNFD